MAKPAKKMGKIRVIRIPAGDAPLAVKKAWVGLELPCYPIVGYPDTDEREAVSGKRLPLKSYGVSVPQRSALRILRKVRPTVADWWQRHGFPQAGDRCFSFTEREVVIISGVKRQQVHQFNPADAEGFTGHVSNNRLVG